MVVISAITLMDEVQNNYGRFDVSRYYNCL